MRGTARLGRRTKHLVKRLRPGDVAVIDHVNIDRIAAEELIATGARAVLNASESTDGRYPNAGPLMLARAGILLVDFPEADPFEALEDGSSVTVFDGTVSVAGKVVLRGRELAAEEFSTSSASGSTTRSRNSPRTPSPTSGWRPTS